MAKLTLIIFVVKILTSVWCNVDFSDYTPKPNENIEELTLENDETGRSNVSMRAFASTNAMTQERLKSVLMPPNRRLLECYVCTDCPKILPNTTTKFCPPSADYSRRGCVVYSEKYANMKNPWFIRGCASERGDCQDLQNSHQAHKNIVDLTFCLNCEGDRCNVNGVSQSSPSLTVRVLVLMITPLLGKYTMS